MSKQDMIEAAQRYAKADASDPFAFARAITHLRNGIASRLTSSGKAAYYDATEDTEPRSIETPTGKVEWRAVVWRNVSRP